MTKLQELVMDGWSYAVGYHPNYGGYYAQVWRPIPHQPHSPRRQCLIESGASEAEATAKLLSRIAAEKENQA